MLPIVNRQASWARAWFIKPEYLDIRLWDNDKHGERHQLQQQIAAHLTTLQNENIPDMVKPTAQDVEHFREARTLLYYQHYLTAINIKSIEDYQYWWHNGQLALQQNEDYWFKAYPDGWDRHPLIEHGCDDPGMKDLTEWLKPIVERWPADLWRSILALAEDKAELEMLAHLFCFVEPKIPCANLELASAKRVIQAGSELTDLLDSNQICAILQRVCNKELAEQFSCLVQLCQPSLSASGAVKQALGMLDVTPLTVVPPPEFDLDNTV